MRKCIKNSLDYFLRLIAYLSYGALAFYTLDSFFIFVLVLHGSWIIVLSSIGAIIVMLGVSVIYDGAVNNFPIEEFTTNKRVYLLSSLSAIAKGCVFGFAVGKFLLIWLIAPAGLALSCIIGACMALIQMNKLFPEAKKLICPPQREPLNSPPFLLFKLAVFAILAVGHSLGQFAVIAMSVWAILSLFIPNWHIFFVLKILICSISGICIAVTAGHQYSKPAFDYFLAVREMQESTRTLPKLLSYSFVLLKGLLAFIGVLHVLMDLGLITSLTIILLPPGWIILASCIAVSTACIQLPRSRNQFQHHIRPTTQATSFQSLEMTNLSSHIQNKSNCNNSHQHRLN